MYLRPPRASSIRKAVLVVAAAIIASTGVMVAGEAPASADTPRCVSKSEFKRIHRDMKKERVHRIFDIHGKFGDGGAGGYSRIYRECHSNGHRGCTIVEYRDGPGQGPARVASKTWNHSYCR